MASYRYLMRMKPVGSKRDPQLPGEQKNTCPTGEGTPQRTRKMWDQGGRCRKQRGVQSKNTDNEGPDQRNIKETNKGILTRRKNKSEPENEKLLVKEQRTW